MNLSDQFLLRLLAGGPPLTVVEARGVRSWWQDEREGDEGLVAFLVRHDVFTREALHLIEWMRRGLITFTDGHHLFASDGVERARTWLRNSQPLESTCRTPAGMLGVDEPLLTSTAIRPILRPAQGPQPRCSEPGANVRQPLKPGAILGRCLLTEELGRGSTGMVFKAYHQALHLPVAVKVLHKEAIQNDPGLYEQFRFEGRLLAQLNDPHVVRVLDLDDSGDQPYLVLECVEGLALHELIQQSGRIRWDRAARITLQIALGLEAAHKLDVVHRDVKPANILITREGNAKLADLGLAVIVGQRAHSLQGAFGVETMVGTVAYMAPEQARDASKVNHRSDIYSLGCTLYHAITGQIPFTGATRTEVLQKHAAEEPVAPSRLVPDVEGALLPILAKMMAKRPEDRYQTYAELIQALAQLPSVAGQAVGALSTSPTEVALTGLPGPSERPRTLWRTLVERFRA